MLDNEAPQLLLRFAQIPDNTEESHQLAEQLTKLKMVVETLFYFGDAWTRLLAACALARLHLAEADTVLPVLIEGLKGAEERERVCGAIGCQALGPLAAPAVDELVEVVKREGDGNVFGRCYALLALEAIGPAAAEAVLTLTAMLRGVEPDTVVITIIEATNAAAVLGKIGASAREAIPALQDCLALDGSDDDSLRSLRITAAEAIWRIGGEAETVLRIATEMLDDEEDWLRADAAEVLGKLGEAAQASVPHLQRLLEDNYKYVRQQAEAALAMILHQ